MTHKEKMIAISDCSKEIQWLDKKIFLSSLKHAASHRKILRDEIYWCEFGIGVGSEMNKKRPSVVIQVDSYNKTSGNTIVAPITHDENTLSCMIPIETRYDNDGNILLDGAINVSNLMCVSKARLGDKIGKLSHDEKIKLNNVLYKHLAIDKYIADLEKKIESKDKYIEELKEKRADDVKIIEEIKSICKINNKNKIKDYIIKLLESSKDK